uniref:THAP-type domain-containing protein n=1 Tax=Cyanistes caeruleus TaxID=156563 RepID=A0A8C0VKH2_CYACU
KPSHCLGLAYFLVGFVCSFFRFPLKDSKRLIQWLKAVQRDNWTPTKYSFLCSEHFTKDSFSKRLEDKHRLLKPTAVPTIFQLVEKKHDKLDYVRSRRKIARQVPVRDGEALREGGGEVAQGAPSSGQDFMVMQGTKEMEEVNCSVLSMGASSVQARQLWELVEEDSLTSPLERKAVGREETRLFALVLFFWGFFLFFQ